ncbi:MAG: type II toxin-antitoxin system ParD family antitoxin [Terracidiphilus sp.]|jgi:putative addiction module CopG family antidote
MFHRTINLPPESHDFVRSKVESGRYEDAGEVLRAALRALHREEKSAEQERPKSIAEGDVFRTLWEASASSSPLARRGVGSSVSQQ